ncbi:TetR family transcriptional regulator C-terminal domain-containing protein [Streptomyces sp. NPDC060000]|uniref:TetR family transcriptional regulator C-terminal domain-containing protein n=1 Tax=Streptomyces sp. NPDC060000 TaxID=3347031 RepID=UPI0036A7C9EC
MRVPVTLVPQRIVFGGDDDGGRKPGQVVGAGRRDARVGAFVIDALRAWCDGAADRQDTIGWVGGCEIGSLASELAETDPLARTDLAVSFERWEAPIRSGLARMQARGELSECADVTVLATALLAAVQGGMLLSQVRRSSTAYRHAVSAVIDHIESYVLR